MRVFCKDCLLGVGLDCFCFFGGVLEGGLGVR